MTDGKDNYVQLRSIY